MDEDNEKITKRLDMVISLLLELLFLKQGEKESTIIRMNKLKQVGFNNKEIGNIFGKSSEAVAKLLYEIKRKKKRK